MLDYQPHQPSLIQSLKICVVIPAYNNEKTVKSVVEDVMNYSSSIIVVNDGSTDKTGEILLDLGNKITLISYKKNRGKGYALKQAFNAANTLNYWYALTIDADGQHSAEDINIFAEAVENNRKALIIGARCFDNPNMQEGSKFANKFSNFWFRVQTGKKIRDTQSGFRVYPLCEMNKIRPYTSRYEAELELLVRCAWNGIPIITVPINVFYPPPQERVSHFRPKKDFLRITLLNTVLCFIAFLWGYPMMIFRRLFFNTKI